VKSLDKAWTTLFSEELSVALKLREGVSPQELVEKVLRKYLLHPIDQRTFLEISKSVERELSKYGVRVEASVDKNSEAPHGIVVSLRKISDRC
jgi:hypothetical protein